MCPASQDNARIFPWRYREWEVWSHSPQWQECIWPHLSMANHRPGCGAVMCVTPIPVNSVSWGHPPYHLCSSLGPPFPLPCVATTPHFLNFNFLNYFCISLWSNGFHCGIFLCHLPHVHLSVCLCLFFSSGISCSMFSITTTTSFGLFSRTAGIYLLAALEGVVWAQG